MYLTEGDIILPSEAGAVFIFGLDRVPIGSMGNFYSYSTPGGLGMGEFPIEDGALLVAAADTQGGSFPKDDLL